MRITVPSIPKSLLSSPIARPAVSVAEAIDRLTTFLSAGNVTVLSGAGVSVDSGIRAYRGEDGRYMNPNYKPILYHELMDGTQKGVSFRQRYWLRSFLGYPPVRDTLPNTTHFAVAALQYSSFVTRIITQNVDGLHAKAISSAWSPSKVSSRILELHGTLHKVSCNHGHVIDRNTFQDWLASNNPRWSAFVEELEGTGQKLRTNPDGDVAIEGASYDDFVVPVCPVCRQEGRNNNVHKPHLIFFGESIPKEVRDRSFLDVELGDRLFIIGTTLATYSAFRLLKHALSLGKPVLMLTTGPTRADPILSEVEKIELPSGLIMPTVARNLAGSRATPDPTLAKLLTSGIVRPPARDDDDRAPRAAG